MKQKPSLINYLVPLIMIAIGIGHYCKHGMDLMAIIPVMLGLFALYMALFNHPLLNRVLNIITKLWYPIGQIITIILLTVTFILIFAPVGLILRLINKDILNKNFKVDRLSYWIERSVKLDNNYTQQF